MLKSILNLKGVSSISKKSQSTIFGGNGDTIDEGIDESGRVYCRCIGGIGGEGFLKSCASCKITCQLGTGYVCTG